MGSQQCCSSQKNITIPTESYQDGGTNDMDVIRKKVIQPIKPLPLSKLPQSKFELDDDIKEIGKQFKELERNIK
ncbi:hypothetical protein pb186bvf_007343 [Paramecium bursaria]